MTRFMVLLQCIFGLFLTALNASCVSTTEDNKSVGICFDMAISSLNNMSELEEDVQMLRIENAIFDNPILHSSNFSNFRHLEGIKIVNSNITVITQNTFYGLSRLKFIDLSDNKITDISPMAFNGVTVNDLYMNNNPGLRLHDESFAGSTIGHLSMDNCNLSSLDYSVIKRGLIRNLTIKNNRITTLDVEFNDMLKLSRNNDWGFIDLTGNPLHCDCQLAWLSDLMRVQEKEHQKSRHPVDEKRLTFKLPFICHEPSRLKDLRLPLDKESLCPAPKIIGLELDIIQLNPLLVNLLCKSKSVAPASVIMIDSEGYRIPSSTDPSTIGTAKGDEGHYITSSQVNLTLAHLKREEIKCMASNQKRQPLENNNHELILTGDESDWSLLKVNLKNLIRDKLLEPSTESLVVVEQSNHDNSLFVKRYTLLELIGSIIGTFIGTLMFLYCISRCLPIIFKTKSFTKRIPSPGGSSDDYLKTSKTLLISSGNNGNLFANQNDANVFTQFQQQQQQQQHQGQQENLQNIINQMNIQKNPQYWQSPEYVYSSTTPGPEYDVPRLSNFAPPNEIGQMSSTLSRRNLFQANTPVMGSPFIIPNHLGQHQLNNAALFNQSQLFNTAATSPGLFNPANLYNLHQGNFQGTLSNVTLLKGAMNDDERFRKPRNNSNSPVSASSGSK